MNPADDVTWICAHQALVTTALVWLFGIVPIASGITWFSGAFKKLPGPVQSIIQVLAGNILHAVADPPPAPK